MTGEIESQVCLFPQHGTLRAAARPTPILSTTYNLIFYYAITSRAFPRGQCAGHPEVAGTTWGGFRVLGQWQNRVELELPGP